MVSQQSSISSRLIIASLVLLPIFFGLTGYALFQANLASSELSKQQQLLLQSYVLLGAADVGDNKITLPRSLPEPRFNQLQSDLFATIRGIDDHLLWRSPSSKGISLPKLKTEKPAPGQPQFGKTKHYYYYQYLVIWEMNNGSEQPLLFTIFEQRSATTAQLIKFEQALWQWLGAAAVVLLLTQLAIFRWGTWPLRTLAADLQAIKNGKQQQLQDNYPKDLKPVTTNLNALINAEQQQRERYRNTLADLAHSLKTPLAVMRGEPANIIINEQIDRMEEIVNYQLKRAVISSDNPMTTTITIKKPVQRIVASLQKVYRNKAPTFIVDIDERLKFYGDERDLLEILGNLMDNACEACKQTIKIGAVVDNQLLQITVEDDGDGIPAGQREKILQRGERADSQYSGQGIGLSVVVDIVSSYRGEVTIKTSDLGGACFYIGLPVK